MRRFSHWSVIGLAATFVLALGTAALASEETVAAVPEISPASISSALALVAGGVLLLRARRGSK